MKLSQIIKDLETYVDGLQSIIDKIDAEHQSEIEDYKNRNVSYGSSVETNYTSKVEPLRMKKDALQKILDKLRGVWDMGEDVPGK